MLAVISSSQYEMPRDAEAGGLGSHDVVGPRERDEELMNSVPKDSRHPRSSFGVYLLYSHAGAIGCKHSSLPLLITSSGTST